MSIERFFNKSIVIQRLKATGTQQVSNYTATATVEAHLQRLGEDSQVSAFGIAGATHRAWVDINTDVNVHDRIKDPDNNIFQVLEVIENGDEYAFNEHKVIVLKQYNGQQD